MPQWLVYCLLALLFVVIFWPLLQAESKAPDSTEKSGES